jgi:hypothetical protein
MRVWLALPALLPLLVAGAAHAQLKGLSTAEVSNAARNRELDLRLLQQHGYDRPAPLVQGMIVRRDMAPNSFIGVGLANMYGRSKSGSNARPGDPPTRSRKPAVTFVMKF